MSLEAINEQLLRSIGVGLALCDADGLGLRFHNDVFAQWFGTPEPGAQLDDVMEGLDAASLKAALAADGEHVAEVRIKRRRRQLIIALKIAAAPGTSPPLVVVECQNITRIRELESMIDSYSTMVERNTRDLQREKERVEKLLLNIMPRAAYEEFKTFGAVAPHRSDDASVIVLRFEGFEARAAAEAPAALIGELGEMFAAFDRIGEQFGCERIKTTGDAYMAVSGLLEPGAEHQKAAWATASRFVRFLARRNENHSSQWEARVGVASGPVVGSVVGAQKYVYDVFGPAVSRAGALAAVAAPGEVLVDADTLQALEAEALPAAAALSGLDGTAAAIRP